MNEKSEEPEEIFKEQENSEVTIEERMEKKEESSDLQPTNVQGKDENQLTSLEVWTLSQTCGSPKEDEAMLTSSLQSYVSMELDKQESIQCSDSSYMQGMIAYSEIDFPCFVHMITLGLEKYLLRSYEAYCLRELIVETRRLPNNKVLQFDNNWFVMGTSPWCWLEANKIIIKEVQVWISLMIGKAARRTCDFQLDTPHRSALMRKQLTVEEDAIKDNEDTFKRQEHHSDFLSLTRNPLSSHEPCMEDTQDWIDRYEGAAPEWHDYEDK
ncbi:hypothetical protein SUGI_0504450 [Cryptomeria japonica]|nr:hypothetical protein SUGI_0504450 [Cryptomeria japonica]